MASNSWLKKNFGEHQYPSLVSGILSLIGSSIGNQFNNTWAWWGGIGGLVVGYFGGAALQPEIIKHLSSKQLARQKLIQDFNSSVLKQRVNMENVLEELDKRFSILKTKGKILRSTHLTFGQQNTINVFSADRDVQSTISKREFKQSNITFAEHLKQNLIKPIVVNCSGIALGVIAVLHSLKRNYGIPIQIDKADAYGVSQIKTVSGNNEEVDFLIAPEPPFLLASGNKLDDFYRLLPIFSEQQRVLRKEGSNTKWMEVLYLKNSTAEEQVVIGYDVPTNSKQVGIDLLEELEERIEVMRSGDSAIVWEPIATLFGKKPGYYLEKGKYLNWFVCYCHVSWFETSMSKTRSAFINLFVDEWRHCEQHFDQTWKLLCKEETLFIESFKGKTLSK